MIVLIIVLGILAFAAALEAWNVWADYRMVSPPQDEA